MSSHYLLNISDLYCILCSYYIIRNVTVHAAASVNIKDKTWNSVFDRPHDVLEGDLHINIWSDVEETAPQMNILRVFLKSSSTLFTM